MLARASPRSVGSACQETSAIAGIAITMPASVAPCSESPVARPTIAGTTAATTADSVATIVIRPAASP